MLWAAYKWTGDAKYLSPFADNRPEALRLINADALDVLHVRDTWGKELLATHPSDRRGDSGTPLETNEQLAWQLTGDTRHLENVYGSQLQMADIRRFINREGSLWIDRVYFNSGELQRSRLGGVALVRGSVYPGHVVSWRFDTPGDDEKVAILVPQGAPDHVKVIAYNLGDKPVAAHMTGWEVDPGQWEITQGTQASENGSLAGATRRSAIFERSRSLDVTFAPQTTTVLELTLKQKGVPYWSRPDLGIDPDDVKLAKGRMVVTVHSLGAIASPAAKVVLRNASGAVLASADLLALPAPTDLQPKTTTVSLNLRGKQGWQDGSVSIEVPGATPEITLLNNTVPLSKVLASEHPQTAAIH